MALSLPNNPDLERFRRDARRLQRGVRAGDARALALVARHHPSRDVDSTEFPLAAAQLVVARSYGFTSWPRLRHYLDIAEPWRRDPTEAPSADGPVDAFCVLACLQFSGADDPERWAQAQQALAAHPGLPRENMYAAATAGDAAAVAEHLRRDPRSATHEGGPFRWAPLAYLVYSRVPQVDPVETARLLLDHGADPDTGYLWQGLPTPFTALTGCFGEGEQGPGRSPRHPECQALATLLLEHGAEPNDGQTLYNRMFNRDDSHLELLFDYGLGTGDGGVWRQRLQDAFEPVQEMVATQVRWASSHGFDRRLELLAGHGFCEQQPPAATRAAASIHRAGTPEGVPLAVAGGADVDAYEHGRSAFHQAAWIGDVELVLALLAAGADPNLRDDAHGTTPLVWAEYARQPATAEILRPLTTPGVPPT